MVFGDWLRRVRCVRFWSSGKRRVARRREIAAAVQIEILQPREMLTIQIDVFDAAVSETDGGGEVVVTADSPVTDDVTVTYTVTAGSAQDGVDYSMSSGTVTIYAGSTSASAYFSVFDDALNEADESFQVDLTSTSDGVIGTSTATVTIHDDDSLVQIDAQSATCSETDGSGFVTIHASAPGSSNPLTNDLALTYQVTSGSAQNGVDFSLSNGTVTIPAGSNEVDLPFSIIDDALNESTESFTITLVSASYGNIATSAATVSIQDDDSLVQISAQSITVSELDGTGSVMFHASAPGGNALTNDLVVTYQVTSMTALNGADFTMSNGTVTIPAGSNDASADFSLIDDTLGEPTETFKVTLVSATYGHISTPQATVSILDDDGGPTAPEVNAGQLFVVAENSPDGTVVGTVQGTVNTGGGILQNWTLDDNIFQINASTGEITVKDYWLLDFESLLAGGLLDANGDYTVTVTVSDGFQTSAPQTVKIHIVDLDEAPELVAGAADSYLPTDHPDHFETHGLPAPDVRWGVQQDLQAQGLSLFALTTAGKIRDFTGAGLGNFSWSLASEPFSRNYSYLVSPGVVANVQESGTYDYSATATDNGTDWTYSEIVNVTSFTAVTNFNIATSITGTGSLTQWGYLTFSYSGNSTATGHAFTEVVDRFVHFTESGQRYEETRSSNWGETNGEREKTIDQYTISVPAAPSSYDHYYATETTDVDTTLGIYHIDALQGTGGGHWDETRSNGDVGNVD